MENSPDCRCVEIHNENRGWVKWSFIGDSSHICSHSQNDMQRIVLEYQIVSQSDYNVEGYLLVMFDRTEIKRLRKPFILNAQV